jgi:uncharacterized protein YxjI
MDLYIKQRIFTWGDKFDVCDVAGQPRYYVEGEVFSWGKKLHVYDQYNREVAFIKQEPFSFMPTYCVYVGGREVARIRREFSFFRPRYYVDGLGWDVEGSFWEHNYTVSKGGRAIVDIEKEWMTWGDSYRLQIADDANEVVALAVVLTIDCVVEQQNNN